MTESNLVAHARRELAVIGQTDEDPEFAASIVAAVEGFASYGGHSGGSAAVARHMLADLLAFRSLSPLTDNPDEWQDVSDMSGTPMWQNRRSSAHFSTDGGKTYYDVDDPTRAIVTSAIGSL